MSGLSYKELQEKGVFDVPYKAFEFMQSQQAEIDQLKAELALCREENKGLVEIKDRVRDEQQAQIDELKHQKSLQELAINQISQANQEWQRINSDLQKRVDGALNYAENRKLGNGISGDDSSDLNFIIRTLHGDSEHE